MGQSREARELYIELRASVDALGNIHVFTLSGKNLPKIDSINYKQINSIINLNNDPIHVMNNLAEKGWQLVSFSQIASDQQQRPNSPFILYYFKKTIEKE
ncbi:MAG: hypothetical protein ABI663_04105 [Chryseolinea sp.]